MHWRCGSTGVALFLLALAAASTALARPKASISVPASRATIVLLVDVSGSMRAADVKPTRLGAAQNAMGAFADRVPKGVKIGLVSFSTGPDLLVIPTTDRKSLDVSGRDAHDFVRAGGDHDIEAGAAMPVVSVGVDPLGIAELGPVAVGLVTALNADYPFSVPVEQRRVARRRVVEPAAAGLGFG